MSKHKVTPHFEFFFFKRGRNLRGNDNCLTQLSEAGRLPNLVKELNESKSSQPAADETLFSLSYETGTYHVI